MFSFRNFSWVFKGKWQREDGSWWQTNPSGGSPIPYKPGAKTEGAKMTENLQGHLEWAKSRLKRESNPDNIDALKGAISQLRRKLADIEASETKREK